MTPRDQVKRVMINDATKFSFSKSVPVNPIASRRISESIPVEQSVTFGPLWEDKECAFTGGETEFICRGVLAASS